MTTGLLFPFLLLSAAAAPQKTPPAARAIAQLKDPAVHEASGLVASRRNAGVYWTHNDSGNGPTLFAFDREGRNLGHWMVRGATATDWEDIAIARDPRSGVWYLYIGDIGDNDRKRKGVVVWRVPEPAVAGPACSRGCTTAPATAIRLRYPDRAHNAETLLVHPQSGDLYIIGKAGGPDQDTTVFVARSSQLATGGVVLMKAIATLDVPDPLFTRFAGGLTGGDISADGRHVVLCYYFGVYEADLPAAARDFDVIWDQRFRPTTVGFGLQIEGVGYDADGKSMLAITEGTPAQLFEIR